MELSLQQSLTRVSSNLNQSADFIPSTDLRGRRTVNPKARSAVASISNGLIDMTRNKGACHALAQFITNGPTLDGDGTEFCEPSTSRFQSDPTILTYVSFWPVCSGGGGPTKAQIH